MTEDIVGGSSGRVACALGGLLLLLAALGCGVPLKRATMQQLEARASFDMACPSAWMVMYYIDERTKGIAGCGQRITYEERCDELVGKCSWEIDARSPQPVVTVPPAAPTVVPVQQRPDPFGDRL
jgi:hypothetical protein